MIKAGKMKVCLHCDKRLTSLVPSSSRQARKSMNWCPEAMRVCEHLIKENQK